MFGISQRGIQTESLQVRILRLLPKLAPTVCFAAVPAAAYTKSQLYVSLQHSHGSHFIDHSLRSVLESALMPDDNDLFATNLAGMPLLAIHGCVFLLRRSYFRLYLHCPRGSDKNVPVWHSRALLATLKIWYPETSAT